MNTLKSKLANTPLYQRLSLVKNFPAYSGMALPDTPFWAESFINVSQWLNGGEEKQRRTLTKKITQDNGKKQARIPEDDGFIILDFRDNPMVMDAVKCAKDYADGADWDALEKTAKKPFLIDYPIDYHNEKFTPIAKLILSPEILGPVSDYFGSLPVVGDVHIWYSPNKEQSNDRSRSYHSDGLDRRHVQVFIPLEEIDEDTGPLTFLPAKQSEEIYKKLHKDGIAYRRNQKLDDADIYKYCSPDDAIKGLAKPGQAIMADTTRCYHYGSRFGKRPRLQLLIQYYEPFSKKMPLWNRQARLDDFDESVIKALDPDIARNVFGMSHLEYSRMRLSEAA
ncbi:MAG: hypothetical protein ACPGRX_08540 [Bdellovibrionales bacterium]